MADAQNKDRKVAVKVRHLKEYFNAGKKDEVKAVDDISFDIYEGETLGLVGESGSGKTTTGRSIIRLYDPTSGDIHFNGKNIAKLKKRQLKDFRKNMQMIFQDPYASLDPRMKVKDIIAEGIDVHHLAKDNADRDRQVADLLKKVNLNPGFANRYPSEFSGGQRQRIGIARALAVQPSFIIADEPISALDVSIQAQVVNLLQDIQEEQNLTYLFIAHDLSMVKHISDRIAVLYKGKIVELSTTDEVYNHPLHPYTQSLLSAVPIPDPEAERNHKIKTFDHNHPFKEGEELREVLPGHYLYCDEATAAKYA
ncbi:peptide ABC transporter substrate-binding protein [Fructilactobacillus lindneri]|uniref:Oligopeptide ABC transporter, ATP-binding subunit n=2 Tax=Fructilactobacillus lindneri TaxID=53444 RepID=A0A0R2K1K5_9LACO|nr:ATP-binding cassette domain-containing protein [Fructilactobacillus lindneri]ANZ57435.1 peptide ABC transporter substrate-binding protein [Fructilactobacillus lindneri]ANZ58702.1 peptide ABC transporter substrate-binding protein [Fructilactobacillus lindneri]KRN80045.1 oligopeptide ABC transporter, ATP-binding subunit [Fructilactobacillus lindneri DSM 20690 = JCM 11027]POG97920.1 peptide ABC transporter substrate-binding protein [Fructilactobacillus lindneri]POG99252.1 peptide ABC transport